MDKLFNLYLNELLKWNRKFNLTAITDPEEIKVRHFEDSLSVLQAVELTDQKVVDIGAGAGFPGIPLKIARPNIKLTLIEATRKKVEFLKHLIAALELKDAEAVWGRAEDLPQYFGKFDVAVARAVAKLPILIKYCLPYLKPGGVFIAQKQDQVEEEAVALKVKYRIVKVMVGGVKRSLVVIGKL
ncbi:MAG: 16S rRNA (guanine(527)-N(7))-methyltransferase RsmG [Candidatus Margulisiibacteriota bacterium]